MTNKRLSIIFLLVTLIFCQAAAAKDEIEWKRRGAIGEQGYFQLAGSDGCSVYLFAGGVAPYTGGHVIAHVSHKTGKLTWLFNSGVTTINTVRVSYRHLKICGLLAHQDYLYILVLESPGFMTDDDVRPNRKTLPLCLQPVANKCRFKMIVFDMTAGMKVGEKVYFEPVDKAPFEKYSYTRYSLKGVGGYYPYSQPYDWLGHGPIVIDDNGIACLGYVFAIKDGKLIITRSSEKLPKELPPHKMM